MMINPERVPTKDLRRQLSSRLEFYRLVATATDRWRAIIEHRQIEE